MKRKPWHVLAAGSLLSTALFAQSGSSQAIYGMVDVTVRHATSTDADASSYTGLVNGARTSSRLGLRGREVLDNDLQVFYMLEMGVDPTKGTVGGNSRVFNRFSFIGLKSKSFGEVTLGLQNSSIHELLAFHGIDALEVGNNPDWTSYVGTQYAPKYDRAVRYSNQFGSLAVSAIGVLDDARATKDHPLGGTLVYKGGDWQIGGAYMQEEAGGPTAHGKRRSYVAGGSYQLGALRLSGFYMGHENRLVDRKDQTFVAGFAYQLDPRMLLLGRILHTRTSIEATEGKRSVGIVTAEYNLSTRTQPYAGVDYTTFSGASLPRSGESTRLGLILGLRHRF